MLDRAPEQTVTQFRASLRRVIARLDTRAAEERHAEAKAERLVHCIPQPDGMAGLWSTHTAADAEAIYARLTEAAKKIKDGRTMDQRRAVCSECDHITPFNGHNTVIANLEPFVSSASPLQARRRLGRVL